MKKTDMKTVCDELAKAIELDQIYVCRDLLEETDKVAQKNATVKEFYSKNAKELEELRANIDQVDTLLASLRTTEGWTKCKEKQGITVYFNKDEATDNIRTKIETFFPAETHELTGLFTKMVSVFNETDLLPKWFPRGIMKSAEMDQQVTKFSKTLTARLGMPPPVNFIIGAREAHFYGRGFDMSERSSMVIIVSTLKEGEVVNGVPTPATSKGYSPFVFESAFFFEVKKNGIVFKLIQSINLMSKVIPAVVMDFAAKGVVPFEMMHNMKNAITNFEGSIWEKRVQDNPEIYQEIEKRLQNYISEHYGAVIKPLDDDAISTKFSTASTGRKKSRGFRSLSNRFNLTKGRARSASGRKFSKDARRSFNNLEKVELYDFELLTEKEKKAAEQEKVVMKEEVIVPQNKKPEDIMELLFFYFFLFLVKFFVYLGQQEVLLKRRPSLRDQYAGELSKVKKNK